MSSSSCQPKTCCTCHDEPDSRDSCMCGCGYLNGIGPILITQMMVLIGFFFSMAALGDCSFVELDQRLFLPEGPGLPVEVTQTQFIGFLTWQRLDGTCYWYNEGINADRQIQRYFNILGIDWQTARIFGGVSAAVGFYFFCYLLSFICSSQVRGVRYFNVFFGLILVCFQGLTFLVFDSDLCQEYGCTFSRAAGFSVAAMGCYIIASISFLFTKDYPGDKFKPKKSVAPIMTYSEPVEEEEPPPVEEEIIEEEEVIDDDDDEIVEEEEVVDDDDDGTVEEEVIEEVDNSDDDIEAATAAQSKLTTSVTGDGQEVTYGVNPGATSS